MVLWPSSLLVGADASAASKDEEASPAYVAVTTNDVHIPVDQLQWLVKPLTLEELAVEAKAWRDLLKRKVTQISATEIAVKRRNARLAKTKEAAAAAEGSADDAQQALAAIQEEELQEAEDELAQTAVQAAQEVQTNRAQVAEDEEQSLAASTQTTNAVSDTNDLTTTIEAQTEKEQAEKLEYLETLKELRTQRAALIERFNVVLEEWRAKGGEVEPLERYRDSVGEVMVDVSDTSAVWTFIVGWLTSEEGGIKWAFRAVIFAGVTALFYLIGVVVGKMVDKATGRTRNMSQLQRSFLVTFVRRTVIGVGLLLAISLIGIAVTPLLAIITAAGLVIGLALQGTLSNFASGLLLLMYRPFDVDDAIDAGGTSGKVASMNLMSTIVKTWDNKVMVVPNNSIWGNVITNISRTDHRRVDMVFGISYADSMEKAQAILEKILHEHPSVLDDPAPVVKVHELGDSSVNFVVRPWVKPADYWTVYWDTTRRVKEEFDKQGISIPFPQRDVHLHGENSDS